MQTLTLQFIFFLSLTFFVIGAFGSLIGRKNDSFSNVWGNSMALLGSIAAFASAISIFLTKTAFSWSFASSFPLLSFTFRLDLLAAFFLLIVSTLAFLCTLFGFNYAKHYYGKYSIGRLNFFYNLFIAGMMLIIASGNALFFLMVWEITTLAVYFLVTYEYREPENIKAGTLFFIMSHIDTAFILMAFLLLGLSIGSFDFAVLKAGSVLLPPLIKNLSFIFALTGFGIKAGIIPLHIWLPSAHPAAPSHVSALMSGVMIKTGIYMYIRFFFDILPNPPLAWGIAVLLLGAISSLLGVLYALAEHDIKRLLAYHSIENIGIILLGLGSALMFESLGLPLLAAAALVAGLFHTLNHAIFKALLFLAAGSVISETHTRNIEEYGGLIKYMPYTAFFFLIGSVAISGLPPFNGFASEWLTFQSLFSGLHSASFVVKGSLIIGGISLALTGGLAALCFVKVFGVTFLARPRSDEVKHAHEVGLLSKIAMGTLALLCLVLGIFAGPVVKLLQSVTESLDAFHGKGSSLTVSIQNIQYQHFSSISIPFTFIILVSILLVVGGLVWAISKHRKVRRDITWDCGTSLTPRFEITSTGFSRSIITIFQGVLRPSTQFDVEYHDANLRYFPKMHTVTIEIDDTYHKYFYRPIHSVVMNISSISKKVQIGIINVYVLYIFIALIIALAYFIR